MWINAACHVLATHPQTWQSEEALCLLPLELTWCQVLTNQGRLPTEEWFRDRISEVGDAEETGEEITQVWRSEKPIAVGRIRLASLLPSLPILNVDSMVELWQPSPPGL